LIEFAATRQVEETKTKKRRSKGFARRAVRQNGNATD
jgi:hypothetical protein